MGVFERVRPPRVHLAYDHEAVTGIHLDPPLRSLPLVIGVIGDFCGARDQPPLAERGLVDVDCGNLGELMRLWEPRLRLCVPNYLDGTDDELVLELDFASLADFEPRALAASLVPRRAFLERRGDEARIARQLDPILHHPAFQRLEASWRGLARLVARSDPHETVRIRVLSATLDELRRDARAPGDAVSSSLFGLLAEDSRFPEPHTALVVDHEFGKGTADVALLAHLAEIGARNLLTVVAGAAPSLLGLDQFGDGARIVSVARRLDKNDPSNLLWLRFRDSEDARHVVLTVPHVLVRTPHEAMPLSEGGPTFAESVERSADLLWGNASYVLAECLAEAHARHGWCAAISGPESGGFVEDLPAHEVLGLVQSTDWAMVEKTELELCRAGLVPLSSVRDAGAAVFHSVASVQKAAQYETEEATAHAKRMTLVSYQLPVWQFAHYVRILATAAAVRTCAEAERCVQDWLSSYVLDREDADQHTKAGRPLRSASVQIRECGDAWQVVLTLSPRFQLAPGLCRVVFEIGEAERRSASS